MRLTTLLLPALLLASCSGNAARKSPAAAPRPAEPAYYTYRIAAQYPHSTEAYTQGLLYADGTLWEGTGLEGRSEVRKIDLSTGRTERFAQLPDTEFGEGIALLDGELFQLTWQSNTVHVYDAATGRKLRDHRYAGEGWGLTTDGEKLYMSDGTAQLRTLDPATFRCEKRTTVTLRGEPVPYLNELEWIDGKIWANVYTADQLLVIDPATGVVERIVDLEGILPDGERGPRTDVLNGIAYDSAGRRLFVTGKNWPKIYEIELIPR